MAIGEETFDQIRKSTFRVETHWSGGGGCATAFTVATFMNSKRLVLATAAHVLDCPENETVHWKIQQFDEYGDVARQMSFATDKGLLGGVPYHTGCDPFDPKLLCGICTIRVLRNRAVTSGNIGVREANIASRSAYPCESSRARRAVRE